MAYIFTFFLFVVAVYPFPFYWLLAATLIPLGVMLVIQTAIALFSHRAAQKRPVFFQLFVGSLVTLPVGLLGGLFIHLQGQIKALVLTRVMVAVFIIGIGYLLGKRILPSQEVIADSKEYWQRVVWTFFVALAVLILYWLFIKHFPELNPTRELSEVVS